MLVITKLKNFFNELPNKLLDIKRLKEKIYFVEPGKYIEDLVPNIRRLHDKEE